MSSTKKIAEFPNVEAKLQQPAKQSAFERQRAEAEAKRRREVAETAAALEDFVKSFDQGGADDDDNDERRNNNTAAGFGGQSRFGAGADDRRPGYGGGSGGGGGAGKRHFNMSSASAMKSGPGSLGPPPTSSLGKKRLYDGTASAHSYRDRDDSRGRLGFNDDHQSGRKTISKAFDASDDEEETAATGRAAEKAISKPTLRLANLPPTTSPAVIKALMPANLTIDHIKIVPPAATPSGTERKSTTVIVTLSKETPASDIDAAVSSLQNRYLGYGFYLTLHRHLSSAAISSTSLPTVTTTTAISHPFGAKRVTESSITNQQAPQQTGYGGGRGGFAPPTSYNAPGGPVGGRGGILHVPIQPPKDIKKLRMIHKVIESVLEHGPEFEALLMSRPEVQREEKWAWLWDARSEGGIWYRWRLWEIVTGSPSSSSSSSSQQGGQKGGKYLPLFEGGHAWKVPDQPLAYEYTTAVDGFVSESEYNSSDEEDFDDEPKPPEAAGAAGAASEEDMFLNPIAKSKLAHLLARLPTSLSKIRKGDIARVAAFAITHASKGSDEIVDMIVSNVEQPLAYTSANPNYKQQQQDAAQGKNPEPRELSPAGAEDTTPDTSAARLIGLYVVSDILSSSAASGVRHAWRYRQLFEAALRERKTFESLGSLAEKYDWGRLRAEKWKRSVGLVLGLWEGWCVFSAEAQEGFVRSFENPPSLKKKARESKAEEKEEEETTSKKENGRWKTVADVPRALPVSVKPDSRSASPDDEAERMLEFGDADGEIAYSFVGYSDDEGDGEGEDGGDIDGEPVGQVEQPQPVLPEPQLLQEERDGGPDVSTGEAAKAGPAAGSQMSGTKAGAGAATRKRMRAVDMFADSGSEDAE